MAITIGSCFEATKSLYSLKLLAGKNGLCRPISWVYLAEDASNSEFFREGQLLITTGMQISSDFQASAPEDEYTKEAWLVRLLKAAIAHKTCGLILNIGKYISEDDLNLILSSGKIPELCETNRYPLFTMPWEVHIEDLSRDFCQRILNADQEQQLNLSTLLSKVSDPALTELFMNQRLKPVLDYDKAHGTDLTDTLYYYLQSGKSVQKTADALFYHRNTVNHRLQILKQELKLALDSPEECLELYAACLIRREIKN